MNEKTMLARKHPSSRGSILVIVVAAVAIASMIVGSYLLFVNDHRERSARNGDGASTQIRLEQNVLRVQQEIRDLAKTKGEIDLAQLSSYMRSLSGSEPSREWLKLTLDGYENGVASLDSFADLSTSFTALESHGDPFLGAKAKVFSIGVESSATTLASSQSRLSFKKVVVTPRIDVRGIPVSQFTVLSLGTALDIKSVNFPGPIGRIYARSDVQLVGSFSTSYPVVSGGDVQTTGMLTVSLDENPPILFSENQTAYAQPSDSKQAAWLAEARTQYNSTIINPGTLPVSLSLPPPTNSSSSGDSENKSPSLDFTAIRNRCDLVVLVQADGRGNYGIAALRGDPSWLLSNGQRERTVATSSSNLFANGAQSASGTGWQNNPVVVGQVKTSGAKEQVVAAFNYGALGQEARQQIHSIYFEFSNSIADAVILIRGARYLQSAMTIASPWPVLVAGDFNTGQNPVAASVLTTQTVRSVDPNWGDSAFGSAP
jgi:hypothetical protein